MKYSFILDGVLYIHVDSFCALEFEINADQDRGMPCIVWYADGIPMALPSYWSKALNPRFGLRA